VKKLEAAPGTTAPKTPFYEVVEKKKKKKK
jgi:hypothetical protein